MPIRKIDCISIVFADAEPVPFTVPILKAKSLMEDRGWMMEDDFIISPLS
jgi:hypothetical protein